MNTFFEFTNVRLYIDPATTSYLIQIIAGIIIACGAGIGIFWNKIGRLFRNKGEKNNAPVQNQNSNKEKTVITADDLLNDTDEKDKD